MPPGIMVQLTSDHYCAEIPKACYDEVVIGKSMLSDHLPNVMLSNLLNTELWSKVVKLTDDGTPIRKGSSDDIQPNKEVTGLLDEKHEFRFKTFPVRLSEFETGVSCGCITKPRIKKYKKMTKTIYFQRLSSNRADRCSTRFYNPTTWRTNIDNHKLGWHKLSDIFEILLHQSILVDLVDRSQSFDEKRDSPFLFSEIENCLFDVDFLNGPLEQSLYDHLQDGHRLFSVLRRLYKKESLKNYLVASSARSSQVCTKGCHT